jgi:hypothetical protein
MPTKLRHGHAGGHLREMFINAIDAFRTWETREPEPTVELEVNYEPHEITISKACGIMWNCTDILPGVWSDIIEELFGKGHRGTYGAAARLMMADIKTQLAGGNVVQLQNRRT